MTKNWHKIGTVLLFHRKSPYVKMDMLKSVPKTEETKNAPCKEVHFYVCWTERESGGWHILDTVPTRFCSAIQLCRLAALHTGGSHFCFGDQKHEGGSEVEEKDSTAAHTDREKESTLVQ